MFMCVCEKKIINVCMCVFVYKMMEYTPEE